jgi:hypothetical protein
MMMNDDMREEYRDILLRLLDSIPGEVIEKLTNEELNLLLRGIKELDPRAILHPGLSGVISQYRRVPPLPSHW